MLTIFNISTENLASILFYVREVFSDLELLFLVLVGLPLGIWVITMIISIFNPQEK